MYWMLESSGLNTPPIDIVMDLRSQRKIGQGIPFLSVHNNPGAGTPYTVRVVGIVRTLYKLA